MNTFYWIITLIAAFIFMEFMAWFSHKYIMHGCLWIWHKDHHKKHHNSWFERNDLFFIFYAVISMVFIFLWMKKNFWLGLPIGLGIFLYGLTYFLVHDIFIHQRFKFLKKANNKYARAVRKAHKMHHRHIDKNDGECFGMLWVPFKYFKEIK